MPFHKLPAAALEAALSVTHRQYLVGTLSRPQALEPIIDAAIKIGISDYPNATWEAAHRHGRAREYQLVLKGMTDYQDVATGEVHRFCAGDFYVIEPGTAYLQRVKRDTRILFVKHPAGNDKERVPITAEQQSWAEEPLRAQRLDVKAGETPLVPNALKPAVAVALFDEEGRLLLVQRRDSGLWAMPGGTMEMNESLEQCACREVREETGLAICIDGIIGTYSDPMNLIAYSDGEVRREFSLLFAATPQGGTLAHDDESTAIAWVVTDELKFLPMATSQQRRVADALIWRQQGSIALR